MNDDALRYAIYQTFAETGRAPGDDALAAWCGGESAAAASLRRLHDAHALVIDDVGSIRMALPFSAVETEHRVTSGDVTWWANCAWDSLAIPAALGIDATIDSLWMDTGEPVEMAVVDGKLNSRDGFIHVKIPARNWWDDVIET